MSRRARLAGRWAPLLGLLALGCARIAPPGGGPEDRTPPELAAQAPDSGAVAVPRDQPIRLCFSEAMNRRSVRDWFQVAPWPGRLDCVWERDCYTCLPAEGWGPDETYTVLLGAQASDRHHNRFPAAVVFAFATGDSLARGFAGGEVRTRSLGRGALPVYLFPWPEGGERTAGPGEPPALDPLQALRIAQTDAEGRFLFEYVPTGRPLLAAALFDREGDRAYDPEEDLWGPAEEPIVCSAERDTARLELYLVYPDEAGDLTGEVSDSSCLGYAPPSRLMAQIDSLEAILSGERDASGFAAAEGESLGAGGGDAGRLRLTAAEEDSLRLSILRLASRAERARADSARCTAPIRVGAYAAEADSLPVAESSTQAGFRLEGAPPGIYRLRAFRDLDRDGLRGAAEPAGEYPLPVELKPGREVTGLDFPLRDAPR